MKILGYANNLAASPGETLDVKVSCDAAEFRADLVQLVHGDTNPDGPGFKIREVHPELGGTHPGRVQRIHTGSFALVSGRSPMSDLADFSMVLLVTPTRLAAGRQTLMGTWHDPTRAGAAVTINDDGQAELILGDGDGAVDRVASGAPMIEGVWYLVVATFTSETISVTQEPYVTRTNSRFAIASSLDGTTGSATAVPALRPRLQSGAPLQFAAHVAADTDALIGRVPGGLFNGKLDSPRLFARAVSTTEAWASIEAPLDGRDLVGAWDFESEITLDGLSDPRGITDVSPNGLHARTVNMPTRAVTGYNWLAREQNFIHAPHEYGAIHFHEDDLDDARWRTDFQLTLPPDLPSALYAIRLQAEDDTDYVPVYVRPVRGAEKKILFLAPTASYMAYAGFRGAR